MKLAASLSSAACLLVLMLNTIALALEKDIVILGTATPGGGFPIYGAVLARAINQMEPSLEVRTKNTKGSTENVPLLESEKLDIALVQGEVVVELYSGLPKQSSTPKIITAMYSTAGAFVVRGDSPYHSINDLKGRPVVFGARGSGLVLLAKYVLDGMGLDIDRDFRAIYLDRASEGPVMLEDGRAAALWGGGVGWPGFLAVAKTKVGARFISPNANEIDRILAKHTFLRRLIIPVGSYPGQDEAIYSVGSWSFVLARPTLPDSIAYRLASAVHRAEGWMVTQLPQAGETTMANTTAMAPRLEVIHPGVLRYLREIGLIH